MIMISIPILTSQRTSAGESGVSERTEYYTTAKVIFYSQMIYPLTSKKMNLNDTELSCVLKRGSDPTHFYRRNKHYNSKFQSEKSINNSSNNRIPLERYIYQSWSIEFFLNIDLTDRFDYFLYSSLSNSLLIYYHCANLSPKSF